MKCMHICFTAGYFLYIFKILSANVLCVSCTKQLEFFIEHLKSALKHLVEYQTMYWKGVQIQDPDATNDLQLNHMSHGYWLI